jgi:CDGSH-type Zn-finger protein/mannose-6-phosphate isomerase-like protein (cupin superfamily)
MSAEMRQGHVNQPRKVMSESPQPVIAQQNPFLVELEAGASYLWCACGRSAKQPFCDGAHVGSPFRPMRFTAKVTGEVVLCGCKHTHSPPFCDGTHNRLSATYKKASADEVAAAAATPITPRNGGQYGKAVLDDGCFVLTLPPNAMTSQGAMRISPVIHRRDGAAFISQFYAQIDAGREGEILHFPEGDSVLFIWKGAGAVTISGRQFEVGPETAVRVLPMEAFSLRATNTEPLCALITVCPQAENFTLLKEMPTNFDESIAPRVRGVDVSQREPMGDRFYQVLLGEEPGSAEVTEFIGELPRSRAAAHRHLYEEAIMILSGEGFLWTSNSRAAVLPGDILFLPRKLSHSLECTSASGLRLMGVFYPAGSPAINY